MNEKATQRKLNELWKETHEVKQLLSELSETLKAGDSGRVAEELKKLGETYTLLIDKTGAIEPLNIKELAREIAEAITIPEMKDVAFPELQKVAGNVSVSNLKDVALELHKLLEPVLSKSGEVSISNFPSTLEVFGKTITKIDGNTPSTPLFVQLTDGKKVVDLEKLFKVTVNASAGGGSISSTPATGTQNYAVFKQTVGSYQYVGLADVGSDSSDAVWQCFRVDKSVTNVVAITWADGNDNFDNILDNITSLSYS